MVKGIPTGFKEGKMSLITTKEEWMNQLNDWKKPICKKHKIPLIITKQYKNGSKGCICPECAKEKYHTGKSLYPKPLQTWKECIDSYNSLLDDSIKSKIGKLLLGECPKCSETCLTNALLIPSLKIHIKQSRYYCRVHGIIVINPEGIVYCPSCDNAIHQSEEECPVCNYKGNKQVSRRKIK